MDTSEKVYGGCEGPEAMYVKTTTTKSTPTQPNGETTVALPSKQGGIGGGGIAAIIIAVCIVFGVTAVLVVMLKNRDWDFHRLVPPRAMDLISRRDNNNSNTRMASFPNMSY